MGVLKTKIQEIEDHEANKTTNGQRMKGRTRERYKASREMAIEQSTEYGRKGYTIEEMKRDDVGRLQQKIWSDDNHQPVK